MEVQLIGDSEIILPIDFSAHSYEDLSYSHNCRDSHNETISGIDEDEDETKIEDMLPDQKHSTKYAPKIL